MSIIARATVEGVNVKRPNGMPRRRWQRVRHGRRWTEIVQRETQRVAYVKWLAANRAARAERERLALRWPA